MGSLCLNVGQDVHVKVERQIFIVKNDTDGTIRQLKGKISKLKNIPPTNFMLFFNGRKLTDAQKLECIGFSFLKDQLIMSIYSQETKEIEINIRNINFTQRIEVSPKMRVKELKERIDKKQNLPVRKQRLIFQRVVLEDSEELATYGIKENSTIHLATVLTD